MGVYVFKLGPPSTRVTLSHEGQTIVAAPLAYCYKPGAVGWDRAEALERRYAAPTERAYARIGGAPRLCFWSDESHKPEVGSQVRTWPFHDGVTCYDEPDYAGIKVGHLARGAHGTWRIDVLDDPAAKQALAEALALEALYAPWSVDTRTEDRCFHRTLTAETGTRIRADVREWSGAWGRDRTYKWSVNLMRFDERGAERIGSQLAAGSNWDEAKALREAEAALHDAVRVQTHEDACHPGEPCEDGCDACASFCACGALKHAEAEDCGGCPC